MKNIPEEYHYLLEYETKAYAVLATIMPDGTPQATPVWFSTDGEHILINSLKGRVKDRNMRANPNIAISILDPDDVLKFLQVRGKIVEITEEGGWDHIDYLAKKYTGAEKFTWGQPDDVRVIYKLLPK
ncbi:MAG: PPOX class F420-dependent oxidoreductase [Chloroflexi bacterium]|nr:PPOX class F420-dependent oxidoreductase [Chloroflexota bacterium]